MKAKKFIKAALLFTAICGASATASAELFSKKLPPEDPTAPVNDKALYSNPSGTVFCCKPLDGYNCGAADC